MPERPTVGELSALPGIDALDSGTRARLAEEWTAAALAEHASIGSFARFTLQLLAVGAPASLVAEALQAGLDEVRHAELSFAIASAFAGEALGPGELPLEGDALGPLDLPSVIGATVIEGCVGETLAAMAAAEAAEGLGEGPLRRAMAEIAADEARHAALAWRTARWGVLRGGEPVRKAAEEQLEAARLTASRPAPADPTIPALAAWGRIGEARRQALAAEAWTGVLWEAARALLARG